MNKGKVAYAIIVRLVLVVLVVKFVVVKLVVDKFVVVKFVVVILVEDNDAQFVLVVLTPNWIMLLLLIIAFGPIATLSIKLEFAIMPVLFPM